MPILLMILAAMLCGSCARRTTAATVPAPVEQEGETEYHAEPPTPSDPAERAAFFQARKSAVARLDELGTMLGTGAPAAASTVVNPAQWTFIGPQPILNTTEPVGGSVQNLALDPKHPSTIYAGTHVGRLWKTTDAGVTWLPLSDAGPLLDVSAIAVDPVLANTVYVLNAGSIYKSTNGGTSFAELAAVVADPSLGCSGDAFAIHPSVSGTWVVSEFCATTPATSVIYKTTNSGASWTQVATVTGELQEMSFNAGSPNYVYSSGRVGNAVLFEASTDTGTTWKSAVGSGSTALPTNAAYLPTYVGFASAPSAPTTIYLRLEASSDPNLLNFFKSINGGATWSALTAFPRDSQNPRKPCTTAIDPANANTVFAGGLTLYRSTDGGSTWHSADNENGAAALHADNHAMIFTPDGNTAYESNDGGVWVSTSFRASAVTWTSANSTFGNLEFRGPLGMNQANSSIAFGGLQDSSIVAYTGTLTWPHVGLGGDGLGDAVSTTNPNIVYAVTDGNQSRSMEAGAYGTFSHLPNAPRLQNGVLIMDFLTPTVLYGVAGGTLSQTLDGGDSWSAISPPGGPNIDSMAVAPSDSNTLALLAGAIPWVTKNAQSATAATWTAGLAATSAVFGNGALQSIAIDAGDSNKLYVLAGKSSVEPMLFSSDAGMSWQAKNPGPNVTDLTRILMPDPDLPNTLYLGTQTSMYRSSDGGASWYPLASGFPMINVTSIQLQRAARILRVGTTGRGVWDLAVPTTAPRLSGALLAAAGSRFTLTVNGRNFAANSAIWLNGNALATTFVSSAKLTATVAASSVTSSTVYYAAVNTPGNSGGLSDPLPVAAGPTIFPNGMENAAGPVSVTSDLQGNPFTVDLAPGTFTALYGSGVATATSVASYPFPTTLSGVQVMVNGAAAPIYFVSPSQIDFVMPWEIAGANATISVVSGTATSNAVTAPVVPAPQIFTTNQQGYGQGAVLVAGTSAIAAPVGAFPGSAPAARGAYLSIYLTGLGAVTNQPADGAIATGLSPTVAQPSARIGCRGTSGAVVFCNAPVLFSGLAPGFVGLYQVNIQVPPTAISGNAVPLQIMLPAGSGRASNIVTIAVQ